jgi:hypothetical protein
MAAVALGYIICVFLLNASGWLWATSFHAGHGMRFVFSNTLIRNLNVDVLRFPWWQKAGSVVLSSLPLVALASGLWQLRCLFQCYGRKEFFSAATASHLGKAGRWIGLWVACNLISEPLLSLWLTIREPVGHRFITSDFGSSDVVAFFLAVCIAIIAHILQRATELHQESQQFV